MAQRVLLVNKFYYPRGGDCVVTLNTERLLRAHGVDVGVYAMQYPHNVESQFSRYFASQISLDGGLGAKFKALKRIMGLGDIKRSMARVLDDFKPDVVHLHNVHSYLSPVVAQMAHNRGIKVVWTLHDYKLLCPAYTCLREGKPCEQCFGSNKHPVVEHRCMKRSMAASVVAWAEAKRWSRAVLEKCVDAWICPSQFMARKMEQGGFDSGKLKVLCNFVDPLKLEKFKAQHEQPRDDFYCYVGRLSAEKGVSTLLQAAALMRREVRVGGSGPLIDELRHDFSSFPNIHFLGQLDAQGVSDLLGRARFSVVPSEWYENNPLSVIESLCSGQGLVRCHAPGLEHQLGPRCHQAPGHRAVLARDPLCAAAGHIRQLSLAPGATQVKRKTGRAAWKTTIFSSPSRPPQCVVA